MSSLDYLQNWLAFSKLHKPFFTEHGFVRFPNINPPTDENNNAYCEVRIFIVGGNKSHKFSLYYIFVAFL